MYKKYNWLFKGVHKFHFFTILILVFQALDTILSMIIPQYISRIVDAGLVSKELSLIIKFIGITVGLYIFSHLCSLISEFVFAELGKRISYNMKKKLLEKMFVLPGEIITANNDKLLSLFMNDIGIIERLISKWYSCANIQLTFSNCDLYRITTLQLQIICTYPFDHDFHFNLSNIP